MFVFSFLKGATRVAWALGVMIGLASLAVAQEASPAPPPQANAPAPQVSTPPLTPLPQAPGPQHTKPL